MSITLKMVNGDLATDSAGRHLSIEGAEKLAQDLAESLLNNFDPEFPDYFNGSELFRIQQDPIVNNIVLVQERIRTNVQEAVERLIDLQDLDPYAEDEERIDIIDRIDVQKVGSLSYAFFLLVINQSTEPIPAAFEISLLSELPNSVSDDSALGLSNQSGSFL